MRTSSASTCSVPSEITADAQGGAPYESQNSKSLDGESRGVKVGLIASPGAAHQLAHSVLPELTSQLSAQLSPGRWAVSLVVDRLVQPPATLNDLIVAARRRMLAEGWHLAVCVTDLPLQTRSRPVVAHASATHGVAVLSLPALGAVRVSKRASRAIVRLISALVGDFGTPSVDGSEAGVRDVASGVAERLRELGDRTMTDDRGIGFLAHVVTGNARLLVGMLRANRPWQLTLGLSRALVGATGAGVFALISADIWRIGLGLQVWRLVVVAMAASLAAALALVFGAGLWERPADNLAREQVALFNVVTVMTVLIGVGSLYIVFFGAMCAVAFLLLPAGAVEEVTRHHPTSATYLVLAWLATSIATLGGALGAGLESEEAVREAAYTYHADTELTAPG